MDGPSRVTALSAYLAARDGDDASVGPRDPYVGLHHFNQDTARLLFGRSGSAAAILSKFDTCSSVFVIGGSGCGKSSIVRGAVMQSLRLVTRPVQKRHGPWVAVEMSPGQEPVEALVSAVWEQVFAPLYPDPNVPDMPEAAAAREEIDRAVGVEEHGLHERVKKALCASVRPDGTAGGAPSHHGLEAVRGWIDRLDHGLDAADGDVSAIPEDLAAPPPRPLSDSRIGSVNLMLIVDQFEEIFRPEVNGEQRRAFVAMMRHVFRNTPEGVFLTVTMRAEDLHRCAEEPDLPEMVNKSTHLVGWLTSEELREAVVGPARAVLKAWKISDGLDDECAPYDRGVVDRLVSHAQRLQSELEHKSDHLPLFQHALTMLWCACRERWRREASNTPRVTEADLDAMISASGGDDTNWMAKALEKTVEGGLIAARDRFEEELTRAGPINGSKALAPACMRAAMTEMASKDEQGRFHRRFVRPEDVAVDRLEALFGEREIADKALTAALEVLVKPPWGLLTRNENEKGRSYDVAHEALIRNSPTLRRWLDRDAEIVAAIRRVIERHARQEADRLEKIPAGEARPEAAVQAEDAPLLKKLFEPEAVAHGDAARTDAGMSESRRLYRQTYSYHRFGKLALEGLGAEGYRDPDELIHTAEELYRARRKFDRDEARKQEDKRVNDRLKVVGLSLSVLAILGLAVWLFATRRDADHKTQLAELADIYSTSPIPRGLQPIGGTLSEIRRAAKRLEQQLLQASQANGDNVRAGMMSYAEQGTAAILESADRLVGGMGEGVAQEADNRSDVLPARRFVALGGLDAQMREIFGQTYQLRRAPRENRTGGVECGLAKDLKARPLKVGENWLLEIGKDDIITIKSSSASAHALIDEGVRGALRVAVDETQICLSTDISVLTIVRATQPFSMPEVYVLRVFEPPGLSKAAARRLDLLPLSGGSASSLGNEFLVRSEKMSNARISVRAIEHKAGWSVVRFSHGISGDEKFYEAVFAPRLVRPTAESNGDIPAPAGKHPTVNLNDGVVSQAGRLGGKGNRDGVVMGVRFQADDYGGKVGLKDLSVEVAFIDCESIYYVSVSLLRRKGAAQAAAPKALRCDAPPSAEEGEYGRVVAFFPSAKIKTVTLRDVDDLELLMTTDAGETLVFPVAIPLRSYIDMIDTFAIKPTETSAGGNLPAGEQYNIDGFRNDGTEPPVHVLSPYCRIVGCFPPEKESSS